MASEVGLEMPHKDVLYKLGLMKDSFANGTPVIFAQGWDQPGILNISCDTFLPSEFVIATEYPLCLCYDPNITTKVGTVGRICLHNFKDKWFPASLIHKTNEAQAIKPLGKRTQLCAMNNIYTQSEHQEQITFLSYQECAPFCLSNHCAIMTFK
uniref:Uncharacterized protein n=1 Tax=Melopsittacus undulatus TaxID=13146 RepID=A0A8V5G543_MELUD